MNDNPDYEGQQKRVYCELSGKEVWRIAKYREEELFWWCQCGQTVERPREVVDKVALPTL